MNSILERFPIFLCITSWLFLFSCNRQNETTDDYSKMVEKAVAFNGKQEYDSAFFYFNKAKLVCKPNETERKIYTLFLMAEIQQIQNDFSGSEETVTEAIKLDAKTMYLPNLYNQLGIAYIELHDPTNAISYYKKASSLTSDELYQLILKNNIAVVYAENNQFQKAIAILEPLLPNPLLKDNPLEKARVLNNLGYAYFRKNSANGISELDQAFQIRQQKEAHYDIISSCFYLYEFHRNKDKNLAQKYAYMSYQKATMNNSVNDRLKALKYLIDVSDSNQSKIYALKHIQLSDSIGMVRQKFKNQFSKIKYDSRLAIEESEKQKKEKIVALIIAGFILAIGLVVLFYIRRKNQQKIKAVTYETETRISKRLHDELANDVYNAITYAETQDLNDEYKKENLLESLDQIYSRTRNISKENSTVATGVAFEDQLKEMLSSYNSTKTNVIINNLPTVDWSKIKKEPKIAIYRVLQELLVNMKKHSESSHVLIRFENQKKTLHIKYSDNGKGCSDLLKNKKGLQNAENRILAINGTLTFETETGKGFKVEMIVPN
ncbi:MAG: ATP-binding protein [Flavobacterium sp.]|uniref:tetratricopeptide repeat-containing sensor histidine kinase n=1 Tax=Flavobacterium sp. TaxID=239 RepID=UPI0022CA95A2|nr:ATP-binding protein [Flavobacterium sp.]MCZ8198353.1 ATP-binding protein [Flavobacterium sp.]